MPTSRLSNSAFLPPPHPLAPHCRIPMTPRPPLPLLFKRQRPKSRTTPIFSPHRPTFSTTPPVTSEPHSNPSLAPTPTPTPTPSPSPCLLYTFPNKPVPYTKAWTLQTHLMQQRRHNPSLPDALLLLQHEPVYTLGTASSLSHVLFDTPIRQPDNPSPSPPPSNAPALIRTERGGEVTYHGPGQLIVYPILNLRRHRKDLHWYLRQLEQVVINTLWTGYGIRGGRKQGLTGVWVGDEKICAMGLKVSRWVTMHGLALNVCMDLSPFRRIVPCGVSEFDVVSLHQLVARKQGEEVTVAQVGEVLVREFCNEFGPYSLIEAPVEEGI